LSPRALPVELDQEQSAVIASDTARQNRMERCKSSFQTFAEIGKARSQAIGNRR
jgi:hypothetical protein